MNRPLQPVYLFADSQLLFWQSEEGPYLRILSASFENRNLQAAYIGASNGDDPVFYEMFEAAMNLADIRNCRHITARYSAEEERFLKLSDVIVLAGGSVSRGWKVLEESGMREVVRERREKGAVLIGISAGAVQLGLTAKEGGKDLDLLKIVPLLIAVHDEKNEWEELKKLAGKPEALYTGIGIPAGGGMIYHADHVIEAVRKPLIEINNGQQNLIFPT